MMNRAIAFPALGLALAGCVSQTPATPAQRTAFDVAYLSTTVEQCAVVIGMEGISNIQAAAVKLAAKAKAEGATDADFKNADAKARTGYAISSGMKGAGPTCGDFMSGSSEIIVRAL